MSRRRALEFERLIKPLLDRAAAYALAIVGNRADAEDAVQDAALKGYRRFGQYDRRRPFKGWWLAIVRNCCRDLLRRRAARPRTLSLDQAELPAGRDENTQEDDELGRALRELPPAHREVLELRYFGECSYRQIADALGIPAGTVMSRLHAARQALAAAYRKDDP